MNFKIIVMIIVACLAIVFVTQNVNAVAVSFLTWEISLSLALLIFFALAIGFIVGWFLNSYSSYRKDKKEVAEIQAGLKIEQSKSSGDKKILH